MEYDKITRVEIIGLEGREVVKDFDCPVELSFQDDDRTLKIFQQKRQPKLIYNAIKTPDGTILESRDRHDYKTHKDANGKTYMIDGGLSYIRCSTHEDQESLAKTDDEPHEVQRDVLKWGTYGIDGTEKLRHVKISEMEDGHIKAVLKECNPAEVYKNCMEKELIIRGLK